jgi:hypothetical protein
VSVLVAWTATACIGAALSAYLLVQALLDLQALGGVRNGRRWRVWGRILQEGIRLSIHVPFALLGFALLSQDIQPRLSFTVWVLLWGNLGLVVNSLVSVYVRRKADVPIDPELLKAAAALRRPRPRSARPTPPSASPTAPRPATAGDWRGPGDRV